MQRVYHQWFSERLQRNMELLVFGYSGERVVFFPPRVGRFYDYENWGIIGAIAEKIDNGKLQVFCVDSVDDESFYNRDVHPSVRIARYIQYEQYVMEEVLPLTMLINPESKLCAAGCSLGAYHAVNIAFKHPNLFNKALGMSGRYDLQVQHGVFDDLLDGYHDENTYFNMPNQYLANLSDQNIVNALKQMEIDLVVGIDDPFFKDNIYLSDLLWGKQIANNLYIWDEEAHKAYYWRKMVKDYL